MRETSNWIRGQISQEFSLGGYEFTEARYGANTRLTPHSHDFVYFRYVLSGNFTEYFANREELAGQSSLMFRSGEEKHSNHFHTDTHCFSVKIDRERFRELEINPDKFSRTIFLSDPQLSPFLIRLYQELFSVDEYSRLTVDGLMLEIIGNSLRLIDRDLSASPPFWLRRVREYIEDEFTNEVSIKTLAQIGKVHPSYLAAEFRRHFDMTIGDFVRNRRIEYARRKLSESKIPISEIALLTGFCDQGHLTRVFKKVSGITPAAYRRLFNQN